MRILRRPRGGWSNAGTPRAEKADPSGSRRHARSTSGMAARLPAPRGARRARKTRRGGPAGQNRLVWIIDAEAMRASGACQASRRHPRETALLGLAPLEVG